MAETVLAKMAVQIAANTAQFTQGLKGAQNQFKGFTKNLAAIGGAIGAAFGVREVANFALEISKLAGEAKGVQDAFDRLPNSIKLMEDLKAATGGTVSELELMKRAVQASNFDISLEALPKLLQFATLRAQQTGQSVDYLVDSIVTGIGRKSKLILDNLGISAVQLTEALGGASAESASIAQVADAVGQIAERNLQNMAAFSENASTKIQRLVASWENLKVTIGTVANDTGVLNSALDGLSKTMDSLAGSNVSAVEKLLALSGTILTGGTSLLALNKANQDAINEAAELESRRSRIFQNFAAQYDDLGKAVEDFKNLQYQNILASQIQLDTLEKYTPELTKEIEQQKLQIKVYRDLIEVANRYGETIKKTVDPSTLTTIDSLNEKLKDLTSQFKATDISDSGALNGLATQIKSVRNQIEDLEKLLKDVEVGFSLSPDKVKKLESDLSKSLSSFKLTIPEIKVDQKAVNKLLDVGQLRANMGLIDSLREKINLLNIDLGAAKTADEILRISTELGKLEEQLNKLENVRDKVLEIDLGGLIGSGIADMAFAFGQAAAGVGSFGDAVLRSLVNFAKSFGEILISMGTAALAAKTLIKNPIAAIGAGIALLAIAGAASAALQKSQQGFNNGSSGGSGGQTLSEIRYINRETRVYVEGEFKLSGSTAKAMIKNQDLSDSRTKPNG